MKLIVAISACLLFGGVVSAQNNAKSSALGSTKARRTAIAGVIKDMRKRPVPKMQAFVYKNDTIVASGYTTADGAYETSAVTQGTYTLLFVYPSSSRRITVTDVPVKNLKITAVNYMGEEPIADSTIAYTDLMPKIEVKKD